MSAGQFSGMHEISSPDNTKQVFSSLLQSSRKITDCSKSCGGVEKIKSIRPLVSISINNGVIAPPLIYKTPIPASQEKVNGAFSYSTTTSTKL